MRFPATGGVMYGSTVGEGTTGEAEAEPGAAVVVAPVAPAALASTIGAVVSWGEGIRLPADGGAAASLHATA